MKELPFGSSLKANGNEVSLYWELCYGKSIEDLMEEDIIPKTVVDAGPLVVYKGNSTH